MNRRLFCLLSIASLTGCSKTPKPCPSGPDCPPTLSSTPGTVLKANWGSEPGHLGVSDPEEGNPEAPMSLAFDDKRGEILLLDQLNLRIQVFSGAELQRVIPIANGSVQDLAVLPNGNILLLDRLRLGELIEIDRDGTALATTSVVGDGIEHAAELTALFSNERGVWGELGNRSILLLDPSGAASSERELVPGFPAADRLYKAQGTGKTLSLVSTPSAQATGQKQAFLHYPDAITGISTLRVDLEGRIYIATRHLLDDGKATSETAWLSVLDADLKEERRLQLAAPSTAREVFRSLEISPGGAIFQLVITPDAARVERY